MRHKLLIFCCAMTVAERTPPEWVDPVRKCEYVIGGSGVTNGHGNSKSPGLTRTGREHRPTSEEMARAPEASGGFPDAVRCSAMGRAGLGRRGGRGRWI